MTAFISKAKIMIIIIIRNNAFHDIKYLVDSNVNLFSVGKYVGHK